MTDEAGVDSDELARRGLAFTLAGINDDQEGLVLMLAGMSESEVRQVALFLAFQCGVLAEALGPRWQGLLQEAALVMQLPDRPS